MTSGYVLAVQVPAGSSQTECTRRCTAMDSCQGPVWGRKTSCCKRLRQGRSSALGGRIVRPTASRRDDPVLATLLYIRKCIEVGAAKSFNPEPTASERVIRCKIRKSPINCGQS